MKTSFCAGLREEIKQTPPPADANRAFVRECFINGGTVSDPKRSHHFEITTDQQTAAKLMHILQIFGLNPKKTTRGTVYVVYLKDAAQIADILNIMMAHKTLLTFENTRVEKDIRNNLNRRLNFETANLSKTITAATEQIDAIKFIQAQVGVDHLPKPLEAVARTRLEYEAASLEEIGAMLTPPIGKSGVAHRLRKVCEIAENISKKEIGDERID
jgi:DNA-binding protein WhiA